MPDSIASNFDNNIDQYKPFWPKADVKPLAWYLEMLTETRTDMIELLKTGPSATTMFKRSDNFQFSLRWMLAHLVEHDSYHGGQAVLIHEAYKASLR